MDPYFIHSNGQIHSKLIKISKNKLKEERNERRKERGKRERGKEGGLNH